MHTALAILLKSKKPLPVTVVAQAIAKMVMRAKAILITFRMTPFFMQSHSFIKSRFVRLSKFQFINPRCQFFMPDAALEDLAVHQLCSFAARHRASNTFKGVARSWSSSEFLDSGHSAPDMHIPQVSRSRGIRHPLQGLHKKQQKNCKTCSSTPHMPFLRDLWSNSRYNRRYKR